MVYSKKSSFRAGFLSDSTIMPIYCMIFSGRRSCSKLLVVRMDIRWLWSSLGTDK